MNQLSDRTGVDQVLLGQHPCSQLRGGVTRQDRHHGLRQDGTGIQFGRHLVHGAAGKTAPRVDGPLVRLHTREGWHKEG